MKIALKTVTPIVVRVNNDMTYPQPRKKSLLTAPYMNLTANMKNYTSSIPELSTALILSIRWSE